MGKGTPRFGGVALRRVGPVGMPAPGVRKRARMRCNLLRVVGCVKESSQTETQTLVLVD